MKSQAKIDALHMDIALRVAQESYCERKKVGAILVQDNSNIIAYGYNGTKAGDDNCCEDEYDGLLVTKSTVIHAEDNVFRKLDESEYPIDLSNSTMYVTLCPCNDCSSMIKDAGIPRVVYLNSYRSTEGIDYLMDNGIKVEKL